MIVTLPSFHSVSLNCSSLLDERPFGQQSPHFSSRQLIKVRPICIIRGMENQPAALWCLCSEFSRKGLMLPQGIPLKIALMISINRSLCSSDEDEYDAAFLGRVWIYRCDIFSPLSPNEADLLNLHRQTFKMPVRSAGVNNLSKSESHSLPTQSRTWFIMFSGRIFESNHIYIYFFQQMTHN